MEQSECLTIKGNSENDNLQHFKRRMIDDNLFLELIREYAPS